MGVQDVLKTAENETQVSVHINRFHFSRSLVWLKYLMFAKVCWNEKKITLAILWQGLARLADLLNLYCMINI